MLTLDHIAIAAETLEEGVEYVETTLGVSMAAGGKHPLFGTHNRLLGLGDIYLEVIAVDPLAGRVPRCRWFDLDRFCGPPRLTNWICKTNEAATDLSRALSGTGPMVEVSREDLKWHITVPDNGCLPLDGCAPALIDWGDFPSPATRLPDQGCGLRKLTITHPESGALRQFIQDRLNDPRVVVEPAEQPSFEMQINTPRGIKCLR